MLSCHMGVVAAVLDRRQNLSISAERFLGQPRSSLQLPLELYRHNQGGSPHRVTFLKARPTAVSL